MEHWREFCKSVNVCCVIYSVALLLEFSLLLPECFQGNRPTGSVAEELNLVMDR